MDGSSKTECQVAPVSGLNDVGDAGGVAAIDRRRWYVALVSHNTEKAVAERLASRGEDVYVAMQRQEKRWKNGRKAVVDRVVLHGMVFIRCSERRRREIVKYPGILRFMTDRALAGIRDGVAGRLAVIPDSQMAKLKFMLSQSEVPVEITATPYRKGDRIAVVRGSLAGLEGEVVETAEGKTALAVYIDILGCARVVIDTADVAPADEVATNP